LWPGFRSPAWLEPPEPRDRLTGFRSAGLTPGPDSDGRRAEGPPEVLPCVGSAILLRTSESDGRWDGRFVDSTAGTLAVFDGRSAFGLAVSLDLGDEWSRSIGEEWSRSSSLLRTPESEGRPADRPEPPRFAVPKLADGVLTSDRTLDRSNFGREELDRVAPGRFRVGEVWLDPGAATGLERGASSVRRLVSGELELRPETLGAADARLVRLGAW